MTTKNEKQQVILSIQDLIVKFRVRSRVLTSIRNISFDIYAGETVAIVGESGSGKSVLMKTLTNMLESNGYIAQGTIFYYPTPESQNDSKTFFKNELDLVEFHKDAMEQESRRGIVKYNQTRIRKAKLMLQELDPTKLDSLNQEINKLTAKLQNFETPEILDPKKIHQKDLWTAQLKKMQKRLIILQSPQKLAFEREKLQEEIVSAQAEITNFKEIPIWKKPYYHKIVEYVTNYNNASPSSSKFAPVALNFLKKTKHPNDFEELLITTLTKIINQAAIVDPAEQKALKEAWSYFRKPNWNSRARARNNLKHLRGGTIATVFQDPMTSLNPLLSVGYQISEVLRTHQGLSLVEAKSKAIELMQKVGIPNAESRYHDLPGKYSGGMRQRIVIAIALASHPKILICDEPTTALDVTIQAQILELIHELKHEFGFTVIFITHDLGVVANVADRVAVVYAGQIVEYGKTQEIFFNSQHPYTWALLSSLPQLGEKGTDLYSIPGSPPSLFQEIKGDAFAPRNQYALAVDYEYDPPFFPVSKTHAAKTWLLDPRAPKIMRPRELKTLHKAVKAAQVGGEIND